MYGFDADDLKATKAVLEGVAELHESWRAGEIMTPQPHQEQQRIFFGWWIVLVSAIGLAMGYGPIVSFTFGVFFKPLSQEFGWSRSQVSLAFSLSLLVISLVLPVIGRLVDRF